MRPRSCAEVKDIHALPHIPAPGGTGLCTPSGLPLQAFALPQGSHCRPLHSLRAPTPGMRCKLTHSHRRGCCRISSPETVPCTIPAVKLCAAKLIHAKLQPGLLASLAVPHFLSTACQPHQAGGARTAVILFLADFLGMSPPLCCP